MGTDAYDARTHLRRRYDVRVGRHIVELISYVTMVIYKGLCISNHTPEIRWSNEALSKSSPIEQVRSGWCASRSLLQRVS